MSIATSVATNIHRQNYWKTLATQQSFQRQLQQTIVDRIIVRHLAEAIQNFLKVFYDKHLSTKILSNFKYNVFERFLNVCNNRPILTKLSLHFLRNLLERFLIAC